MFERLAGKLLSRLLSKYFRSSSSNENSGTPGSTSSTSAASGTSAASASSGAVNTQLSVWSGYVTLEHLELRRELVNDWLEREGWGIELVHCTLRRVELTVPWSKLSSLTTTTTTTASPTTTSSNGPSSSSSLEQENAVVVVVLDGVHILLRTNLQWNDAAMREESIRKRRQALTEVVEDLKNNNNNNSKGANSNKNTESTFVSFLKRRLSQWHGIAKKLQIHVRDVHIRWEDVESDPSNPFACGVTMESMHIQHDDDDDYDENKDDKKATNDATAAAIVKEGGLEVIRKVAQLNHLAIYWNALHYDHLDGIPNEFSVLHQSFATSSALQKVLDRSIARRSTLSSTLFQAPSLFPKHSYLLLPVDTTMHGVFTSVSRDSSSSSSIQQHDSPAALLPTFAGVLEIDLVSIQFRDYQYAGIVTCAAAMKEHAHIKQYRKYYRPSVSVMEDPRAWWYYAWQVIRYELKSHMRWSWKRFHQRFAQRQRYCDLYERYLRSTSTYYSSFHSPASTSTRPSRQNSRASELDNMAVEMMVVVDPTLAPFTTPDDGAGPSNSMTEPTTSFTLPANYTTTTASARGGDDNENVPPPTPNALTIDERQELQAMEDGLRGELSIDDIILYRALVTSRLQPVSRQNGSDSTSISKTRSSWWRWAIQNEVMDDREAAEELNRLMAYVEQSSDQPQESKEKGPQRRNQPSLSIDVRLGQGCIALFSPLEATASLEPRRRLQERFFELSIVSLETQLLLMGDFSTFRFHAALANLLASEIRSSRKHFTVIARSSSPSLSLVEIEDTFKGADPLFDVEIAAHPPERENCDLLFRGQGELLHVFLAPDCEWVERIIKLVKYVPSVTSVESFWEDISMAMINSWGRGLVHLRKKATAVIFNQKTVEVNLLLRCPVVHIGGGSESETLIIDLGTAHLTTEKLGGSTVFKQRSNRRVNGSEDQTPASPKAGSMRRKLYRMSSIESPVPDRFDLRSTNMSVEGGFTPFMSSRSVFGNTNFGESIQFGGEDFPDIEFENPIEVQERHDLQSCFYDTYQLRVRTEAGTIFWADDSEGDSLLESVDVRIFIKKSVLPADHTLCKLKCNCLVDSLCIGVSVPDILRLARVFKVWHEVFGKHKTRVYVETPQEVHNNTITQRLFPISTLPSQSLEEDASDCSSQLDENEFFDTVESEAESGAWFEETLIGDPDQVLDTGSKAVLRARRRPRLPSVSDVSSSSDQSSSHKQHGRRGITYLSAENLAKLDERAVEEDSVSKVSHPSAADTFHSAISLSRQNELATDLERSILEVEANISLLNDKLSEAKMMPVNSSADAKQRRFLKRHVLLELERSAAELRALRSAQDDLKKDMITSQDYLQRQKAGLSVGDVAGGEIQPVPPTAIVESLGRARALVMDRSRRRSLVDADVFHTLTRNLNRNIFTGSITFGNFVFKLRCTEQLEEKSSDRSVEEVSLAITQSTLCVVYRAKDIKLYGSIDHVCLKSLSDESDQSIRYLLLGGASFPLAQLLLSSQYPQHLSTTTMDERLLRVSLQMQRGRLSLKRRSARMRVATGDIEFQPHTAVMAKLIKSVRSLTKEISKSLSCVTVERRQEVNEGIGKKFEKGFLPLACLEHTLLDVYLRLTAIRVRLTSNERTVGAIALTEVGLRLLQDASDKVYCGRGHTELRLGNAQLLDIDASESFTCVELFGKKESLDSLVRVCLRWQLVPSLEQGGWAVDRSFSKGVSDWDEHAAVWNFHCGAKIQSVAVLGLSAAASRQVAALNSMYNAFKAVQTRETRRTVNGDNRSHQAAVVPTKPVRWRGDLMVTKIFINFPCAIRSAAFVQDESNSFSLVLSLSACLQVTQCMPRRLSLRVAATGLSVLRSLDEWPLIDIDAAICEAQFGTEEGDRPFPEMSPIRLPSDSPWNTISAVMHRYRWDDISTRHDAAALFSLAISVANIHVNFSPPVYAQLVEVARLIAEPFESSRTPASITPRRDDDRLSDEVGFYLSASLELIELRLFREVERKPARITILIEAQDCMFSTRSIGKRKEMVMRLGNVAAFDLSFPPGVRVVGKQISEEPSIELNASNPFFLMRVGLGSSSTNGKSITVGVDFGHIHCLVVPSLFQSLLTFSNQLPPKQTRKKSFSQVGSCKELLALPFGSDYVAVTIRTASFECVLSARDVQNYIEEKGNNAICVVIVRWSSTVETEIRADDFLNCHAVDIWPSEVANSATTSKELWPEKVDSSYHSYVEEEANKRVNSRLASVKLDMDLNRFLVARTAISKQKEKERKIGTFLATPFLLLSSFPAAGEQRITNYIDCTLTYRAICSSKRANQGVECATGDKSGSEQRILALSQVLRIDARLVDVLVYINQSPGGINDAIRVTVLPIVSMVKKEDNKSEKAIQVVASPSILDEMIRNAITVWSVHAEGFQITCVPGGATRLTESPIIKCALSKFEAGGGLLAAPRELKWLLRSGRSDASRQQGTPDFQPSPQEVHDGAPSDPFLTRVTVLHLVTGAWVNAELSASYHNRRLVAWEPFVEPWVLSLRIGADLTQLLSLNPLESLDNRSFDSSSLSERSSAFPVNVPSTLHDTTGERMRETWRMLRSPFKLDAASRKNTNQDESFLVLSQADLCYHLVASASRAYVTPAVYCQSSAAKRRQSEVDVAVPPGNRPQDWLQRFGHPELTSTCLHSSLVFSLSDSMTLNVNLTGALLENLLAYLRGGDENGQRPVAPHRIRNDTGMAIRFQEVLDPTRLSRGERASKKILSTGAEIPLSLKRSLSQSCDPHRAFVLLELGSFEDTAGRLNHNEFERPEGSLFTAFYFKVVTKIPVDTVGVHKYPLCRNLNRRASFSDKESDTRGSLGYVIVRVALQGGVKLVSIESPFVLKNDTDVDIICELRSQDGLSLLWRHLIPKLSKPVNDPASRKGLVSIPVDLVSSIHDDTNSLSIVALPRTWSMQDDATWDSFVKHQRRRLKTPPPFSKVSVNRGVLKMEHFTLRAAARESESIHDEQTTLVHLNVCSVRIGSFSFALASLKPSFNAGVNSIVEIPEQRLVLFQSPLVVQSHLPTPIQVQVRLKEGKRSASDVDNRHVITSDWEGLGTVGCGEAVCWTGASAQDKVEIRCRLLDDVDHHSELFPNWSSVAVIPPAKDPRNGATRTGNSKPSTIITLKLQDCFGQALSISLTVDGDSFLGNNDVDDVKQFAQSLPLGTRVVKAYVPFWVVDSTNQDLEFFAGTVVAGQQSNQSCGTLKEKATVGNEESDGLAELFNDDNLSGIARPPFEVLMIGDEKASRLTMRRRMVRAINKSELVSPWANPIVLRTSENAFQDVQVPPPSQFVNGRSKIFEPYALRSRIFSAPERFGGALGTKILHIVNRFEVINEMGRDIEILADRVNGISTTFKAERLLRPFHFDDSGPIRFRPKELGWFWSGKFEVSRKRKELTLRLRHKLRNETIIASVEFYTPKNPPITYIVFRNASHPPFRIENHTMHPLNISQISGFWSLDTGKLWSDGQNSTAVVLLPYQNMGFAWDQPEAKNSVMIEVANIELSLDNQPPDNPPILGCYDLERIAPGTKLRVQHGGFAGQIVADGPTRIVRLTDSASPVISSPRQGMLKADESSQKNLCFELRLIHGIGVSIVDWNPQELLYVRLDDVLIERTSDEAMEHVNFSVASITIDNQLWLTPYPVIMSMGRLPSTGRRRLNRPPVSAMTIAWDRRLNANGAFGNLTLLERVEVTTEPIVLNVDAQLVDLIAAMLYRIVDTGATNEILETLPSRNSDLRKVLGISDLRKKGKSSPMSQHTSNGNFVVLGNSDSLTAVFATKQKFRMLSATVGMESAIKYNSISKVEWVDSLLRPRQKIYLERLRIATAKSEISWSGPLPGALMSFPQFMRPALTFEGLPLFIRPYSCSHKYGTLDDHLEELKSHYLSIWRIVDLLVGLAFNPTFIIRAWIYTIRERVAVTFDSLSKGLSDASSELMYLTPRLHDSNGVFLDETRLTTIQQPSPPLRWISVEPLLTLSSSVLLGVSKAAAVSASIFRYGPRQNTGASPVPRGVVRSRNPRLFATADGNDLLVEYVEGENAGRALLSRVRMGAHSAEGYLYHSECTLESHPHWAEHLECICMVTSERILILNGVRDVKFCSVKWEAKFENVVHLEVLQLADAALFDQVRFWYLSDADYTSGNNSDLIGRYAQAVVGALDLGLDVLICKELSVPKGSGVVLRDKVDSIRKGLDQSSGVTFLAAFANS